MCLCRSKISFIILSSNICCLLGPNSDADDFLQFVITKWLLIQIQPSVRSKLDGINNLFRKTERRARCDCVRSMTPRYKGESEGGTRKPIETGGVEGLQVTVLVDYNLIVTLP